MYGLILVFVTAPCQKSVPCMAYLDRSDVQQEGTATQATSGELSVRRKREELLVSMLCHTQ